MSLSKNDSRTTQEEDTPVSMRIQLRNATVKALHTRRHPAYQQDDIRLVRRSSVLLDLMIRKATVPGLCER